MSRNNDRHPGGGQLVWAAGVVAAVLIAAAWLVWTQIRSTGQGDQMLRPAAESPASVSRPEELLSATLYVPVNGMLTAEAQSVAYRPEPQLRARELTAAVLSDKRSGSAPVLKDVKLRALFLDGNGTAFIDLSLTQPYQKEMHAPVWDELLAVYAIVNTVMQNVPEVKQVRFLLEGRESATLAGHIDLSRPLVRRSDLVRQTS